MDDAINELVSLFEEARKANEFEFILTLINYKGIGPQEIMANLHEWFDAMDFYKRLYDSHNGKEKARLGLLLYSNFFESSDFYNIIGSLCRITLGFKGSSYLFWKTRKYERLLGVGEKKDFVMELLSDAKKNNIAGFFEDNYIKEIRNAFFHSAYSLTNDEMLLHDSDPVTINGIGQSEIPLQDFLYPRINNVLRFFATFKKLYLEHFASYRQNKIVIAHFPHRQNAEIIGSEHGLRGFRIPNAVSFYGESHASGIWYDEQWNMWAGHNIRQTFEQVETIEISDQIARYEGKTTINKNSVEFDNLVDKVLERRRPPELLRISHLLIKFGNIGFQEAEKTSHIQAKKNFAKSFLPYYQKAIEAGRGLADFTEIQKRVTDYSAVANS